MKRALIVGAGGFGRELYFWMTQHPDFGIVWRVDGFLDDNRMALDGFNFPVEIVGGTSDYTPLDDDLLVCALGLPKVKRKVCGELKSRGARFLTFIHPSAVVGGLVSLGEGVVLCPGVILTTCIRVDEFVMFNCNATAGHDVVVEKFSTISGHCDLTGRCKVGEGVFMGSSATLIPGTQVGADAVIGAGAVVIRRVAAGTTVFGNPARLLTA